MSHFLTLVILPEGTGMDSVHTAVDNLMTRYDETRQVETYQRQCWCVGLKARKEVQAEVENTYPIEELRTTFAQLPNEECTQERWLAMVEPRVAMEKELFERHPLKDMPSDKCANCDGVGAYFSETNPEGKWDWCVIGGRWDGWIFGPDQERASRDAKGFNFGDEHHTVENNTRPVHDIPIDDPHYVPFAVVTPDGEWHEAGTMNMWAIVTDAISPDEWHKQVKDVLAQYPNNLAVAVDCHT